jgi:hypothetical protein
MNRREKDLGGNIPMGGRLVARKISTEGTEAIRGEDQRRSSADIDIDGKLSYIIKGSSPQGETGSIEVCKALIECLNKEGSHWREPRPIDFSDDYDCIAYDGSQELHIQVTRALEERLWRLLANEGKAGEEHITVKEAADDLWHAIEKKKDYGDKGNIILAIDARDTPGHALQVVVESCWQRHKMEIRELGFKAIWVVGPIEELIIQLDCPKPLS